jgi:hypothetical protein
MTYPVRRKSWAGALVVGFVILVAAGAGVIVYAFASAGDAAKSAGPGSPTSPARLRVADLMNRAGCKGSVIGTQLYSYETGRCDLGGAQTTIAVFDTDALRDKWIKAGKDMGLGGTIVAGSGWAAWVLGVDGADKLAATLGGTVV